jgi:hypothetical protein
MGQYPQGGMAVENLDTRSLEVFDVHFTPDVFTPTTADRLYPVGTLLGRLTADATLTPYTTDDTPAGSGAIVGVLGSAVQASGVVAMPIRFITSGRVYEDLLLIDDTSPAVIITTAIKDELRAMGIDPVVNTELFKTDNQ